MADVNFQDNHIQVIKAIGDAINAFLEESAGELESQAMRNTRVDMGQTKGAWGHMVDESKHEAVVGNTLENAIWEEFGTGEYALKGDGRKGAWYVPVDKVVGKKKPSYNGKVVIVYGKNKMKYYKTNGKRPSKAFTKAKQTCQPKIIQAAKNKFGGIQ